MKYTAKSVLKSKSEQHTNSVLRPIAPTATVCGINESMNEDLKNALISIEAMKAKHKREARLALFLLETGCRVSEALQLSWANVDALGRVRIEGKKGSNARILFSPSLVSWLLQVRAYKMEMWEGLNRFYIYRVFKLYGIGKAFGNNEKMSITHYFRHLNAIIAREITSEVGEISALLGHKKQKNTEIYLKEERTRK